MIQPKVLKGGCRQQARNTRQHTGHSQLAEFLLKTVFWGNISLQVAIEVARLARLEGVAHRDIEIFAGLGDDRDHETRTLYRKIRRFPSEDAVRMFKVHIKPAGTMDFPIVLPHALFATLFSKYNDHFKEQMFGGRRQNIQEFWYSQRDHPAYAGHAMHTHARFNFEDSAIPLFVHGDDVASVDIGRVSTKAVDVVSWGPLLSSFENSPRSHL